MASARTTLRRTVPFAQMDNAGADLGEKVEKRVRAHGANGAYAQTEDEDREQQNAAPDSRHSDEGPDSKTHQALDQQIHDSTGFSLSSFAGWRRSGAFRPTPQLFR
jgi:hypothetical protein